MWRIMQIGNLETLSLNVRIRTTIETLTANLGEV